MKTSETLIVGAIGLNECRPGVWASSPCIRFGLRPDPFDPELKFVRPKASSSFHVPADKSPDKEISIPKSLHPEHDRHRKK